MDSWVDGGMDGWMSEWVGRWVDGWMKEAQGFLWNRHSDWSPPPATTPFPDWYPGH